MRFRKFYMVVLLFGACTTAKVPFQETLGKESTRMPVKGLNGWMVNQRLSFGDYRTSSIKRGWDFSSSLQYARFRIRPEDALVKVFNIGIDDKKLKQRYRFRYFIESGKDAVEVYATEKFSEDQLVYKSNNPFIGNVSKTKKYEYAFTAGIIPLTLKDNAPWSLVLINC